MRRFYKNFFLIILIIAGGFSANFVFGAEPLEAVINEIAWMGTEQGWRYEWIEFYNTSEQAIDLTGWKIENTMAKQGVLEVSGGEILPQDYFLICKKKIAKCDLEVSLLSLHNDYKENGGLVLKDATGNIIDQTPEASNSDWPAGDNKTKQTMERKNSELSGSDYDNWQTSQESGGTPRALNSELSENGFQTVENEEIDKIDDVEVRPQHPIEPEIIIYPSGVIINEILPSPEGADAENEWIEIFNQNDFKVDLSGWKITDTVGKTKIYTFSEGTKISAKGFLVLWRPETKITLNNSGDGLKFIQPDGKVVDEVVFGKATLGKSYSHLDTGWTWSNIPTPNSQNIIPELEQVGRGPSSSVSDEDGPRPNLVNDFNENKELASVSALAQNLIGDKLPKSFLPLFIALVLAIFSGAIIFFLKKNLKQEV